MTGLAIFLLTAFAAGGAEANSYFSVDPSGRVNSVRIRTWKEMRNNGVVIQQTDYSCGAASLATVLTYYYGLKVGEQDILEQMDNGASISFSSLQSAARKFGFQTVGVTMPFERLKEMRIPAIVHVKYRKRDHFTVVKAIDSTDKVFLADPSWGNSRIGKSTFLGMWQNFEHGGKVLIIIPEDRSHSNPVHASFQEINSSFIRPRDVLRYGRFSEVAFQ
ncbi:MAG: C39 family peptidase [Pseudomonadota bacterium]